MRFYTSIVPWYERIFPVDSETTDFLAAGIPAGGCCLDLACGTGGYARALAARGFTVEACDLDEGMIAAACAVPAGRAFFHRLDMRAAPAFFSGRRFDLVCCIGNSLVHLPDAAAVETLLTGLRPLLAPQGALILGVVNYDRILDERIDGLPTIRRPGLTFERRYRLEAGWVRFATTLTVEESGATRVIENEVSLLPLRREELARALSRAGFASAEWFADTDGAPWAPGAIYTIVRARA